MSRIQLVAETPRAGKWNHRFIVSPTCNLSDSEVAKVVATASRSPQGEDYLAVSVEAKQVLSGRTGTEILVLTGIEVNKLSDSQRQRVMVQLKQWLADLATLVTEKIDWEQEIEESGLVKRPELAEWEKYFSDLPLVKKRRLSQSERKRRTNRLMWAGSVVGILLIGIAIWQTMETKSPVKETKVADTELEGAKSANKASPQPAEKETTAVNTANENAELEKTKEAAAKWWAELQKLIQEAAKGATKWWAELQKLIQEKAQEDEKRQREVAEQKLQNFIEKYQSEVSIVKCDYLPAYKDLSEKKANCVSPVCNRTEVLNNKVLNHLKSYKKGDALDPTLKHWCSLKEEFLEISKVTDKNLNCLSNWKYIKPVIDFIEQLSIQLNEKVLCPN